MMQLQHLQSAMQNQPGLNNGTKAEREYERGVMQVCMQQLSALAVTVAELKPHVSLHYLWRRPCRDPSSHILQQPVMNDS